ncbi:copper chaperone PCu(A)C [Altererythrobacter aurantiacus]|uniref:Copper chaperone PCu(A)C n=1 Tax=Parapontixanthobacter aurantiacus TaxID=1463599 RepID=A0A844ZDF5_9SPHN|nr:copper chaperone PCu(A)C [Parapontixanthobacter aurantiacus]MXO85302.1 copper chaperone PCu(A)C [Parapontixanthobacter aurantiacus]
MTLTFISRRGFAAFMAASALALSGCGETAEEAPAPSETGLAAENARLVLPAVEGNPGAVYFDLANRSEGNLVVRAASVEGASSTDMHEMSEWNLEMQMTDMAPLMIEPGSTATFEPGGRHLMAHDLPANLTAGDTVEVTLTVLGGDKFSFPATVQEAGEDR